MKPVKKPSLKAVRSALRETARVAAAMADGDLAGRIITERAWHYLKNPDPRHRFMAGDYYDVDHAGFLAMKKFLLRLETLPGMPCCASLWLAVPGKPGQVAVAVQNGTLHRYYRWAMGMREMEPEMARCLSSGEVTEAPDSPDLVTVLAPVRNSLGDAVGFVELTAPHPASKTLAPAWS